MTEEGARRSSPISPPRAWATAGAAGAAFAGIAVALGLQMHTGRDPALGATTTAAATTATRRVVVRRIVVVDVRRPAAPAARARSAPAPAAAPAPAPVVTRTS